MRVSDMQTLQRLRFADNRIAIIPQWIGNLTNLNVRQPVFALIMWTDFRLIFYSIRHFTALCAGSCAAEQHYWVAAHVFREPFESRHARHRRKQDAGASAERAAGRASSTAAIHAIQPPIWHQLTSKYHRCRSIWCMFCGISLNRWSHYYCSNKTRNMNSGNSALPAKQFTKIKMIKIASWGGPKSWSN